MNLYGGIKQLCSSCNKELNPPYDKIFKHGKKILCECCEQERTSSLRSSQVPSAQEQEDKQLLFKTIQSLFNISEIPEWWIAQIDKLHKEGKTYFGMEYTLKYAILYQGFVPQQEFGISGVISIFYKEASKNFEKEEKTRETNEKTEIVNIKKTINIKPPKTIMWKPTSNIEDL